MDETDLIVEQAILNVVATVTKLDDYIKQENNEQHVNDLKIKRDILVQALRDLGRYTIMRDDTSSR